ncbi:MAG: STAS domain-containing protein, partial [Gammaproteobacteria bacterium]|nr:STAS domain-containing protein [Gammaproteobacteria bacterium]
TKVNHMSSMAIGVLATAHSRAKTREIQFAVCNIEDRIQSVLVLVKLMNILTVYETREAALAAMNG